MKKPFIKAIFTFVVLLGITTVSLANAYEYADNTGKNLYLLVLDRIRSESTEIAVSRTLGERNLTKEELYALIPGASISEVIAQPEPGSKATTTLPQVNLQELQDEYEENKELAEFLVNVTMEVEQTELFANGDENDSGFDLLVDLDMIDAILFGKSATDFSGMPGGAVPGGPSGVTPGTGGGTVIDLGLPSGQTPPGGSATPPNQTGPAGQSPGAGSAAPGGTVPSDEGVLCPIDPAFNAAVATARANENAARGGTSGAGGSGAQGGQDAGGQPDSETGSGNVGDAADAEQEKPLVPEQPANWDIPEPCTNYICLKFEAVYKKASTHTQYDDCIACHFEKINDAFKKTVDHNLVPSKATGNLLEAPKCKRSLFNLKWNFILIPQPIVTPPNDDLVTKGDFLANAFSFYQKYYDNPGRCEKDANGRTVCKPDVRPETKVTKRVLEQATSGTSQSKILQDIREQVAVKTQEALTLLQQYRLENDAIAQAEQFQVLLTEFDTMNAYFESFIQIYSRLSSDDTEAPCTLLRNKATCS